MESCKLLTFAEVAKTLRCSVRQIWRIIGRGDLVGVRFGQQTTIPQGSLEEFIARQVAAASRGSRPSPPKRQRRRRKAAGLRDELRAAFDAPESSGPAVPYHSEGVRASREAATGEGGSR